jgi:hypothetical protein
MKSSAIIFYHIISRILVISSTPSSFGFLVAAIMMFTTFEALLTKFSDFHSVAVVEMYILSLFSKPPSIMRLQSPSPLVNNHSCHHRVPLAMIMWNFSANSKERRLHYAQ